MSATALLGELRDRGVEVWAAGDRLQFRPVSAIDSKLVSRMREHKAELLALVTADPADESLVADTKLEAARTGVTAALLTSKLLSTERPFWVAFDPRTQAELEAEESEREQPRPVLRVEDVYQLEKMPLELRAAALKVLVEFPGAVVVPQ